MSSARRDGIYLVAVGSLFFVLFGAVLQRAVPTPLADFRAVYFPSKTLVGGRDPFSVSEVMQTYRAERGNRAQESAKNLQIATENVYPPSTLFLVTPLAMLPARIAEALWTILTFAIVILASLLIWNLSADYSPRLAGALVGFLLVNSVLLAVTGNVAGVAIGLSAVAVWCFARERFVALGVLSLALSLVLKPHDTGLVWLYFLLAGAVHRKRAVQTLLAAAVLAAPGIWWTWLLAPHWIEEWKANLAAFSARGGINDPGLLSSGGHGLDAVISLQAVFSVFKDDPRFYGAAALVVCAPLLLIWIFQVLRHSNTTALTWMALAVIAPLSMLPIYHRQVDAALLMLAIPGCAVVKTEGGIAGRASYAITAAALGLTGIFCWAGIGGVLNGLVPSLLNWGAWWGVAIQVFPAPLILLGMSTFFLWRLSLRRA